MKDRKVHRRLIPWNREEIPEAALSFAERRVSYLEGVAFEHTLRYLLACAYLQGINDSVQAHINNPWLLTMDEVR
jgi:hypothetical protein